VSDKQPAPTRDAFRKFFIYQTRWRDNDVYGHLNNAVYYEYFDSAVNQNLIEGGVLDVMQSPAIGLVAETRCTFHSSVGFPDTLHIGLRVDRLGNSSVRYQTGIFCNDDQRAAAVGEFVHVYVERGSRKSTPIPGGVRRLLQSFAE
jgi:acyl-CoA thioester hydrolase